MIKAQGGIFGWVSNSAKALPVIEKIRLEKSGDEERARRRAVAQSVQRIRNRGAIRATGNSFADQRDEGGCAMTMQRDIGAGDRWWVPGDWNGFFGLFTNVLLNVIVLTTLCLFVVHMPANEHRLRAHPAGARHRSANRQSLLRLSRLAAGQAGGAQRRDGDAVRPQRAAYVHRRLRHHAADLPQELADHGRGAGGDPRLAGGACLGLHHRRDRADRRLCRPDHPEVHAASGDARHARRHLDHFHRHAAGIPDVGGRRGSPSSRSASC